MFLFALIVSVNNNAQSIDLKSPLPVDHSVKKGILANGMTYYIKNTDVTKGVASYYIIQNVGSVLEKDNQQGLAHFLEHMAFNGTENFEGKGVLNAMQKHGLVFGRDINAYTSFDETVYNINNIPSTPELIDTGLLILHDWSNYLLLTNEEIDAERGVIKEEWRTRQSGPMRILQQSLPTMFNSSIYAKRLPIGSMDVVANFKYKALRDFYHDWYRTDLQAIAIVGDVDVAVVEKKIKALFSKIPAVTNPKERFLVNIPENQKMLYVMAMDKEVTTPSITFGIRHPKLLKEKTIADLKESLLNSMVTTMLSKRLKELSIKSDATFLGASVKYGQQTRTTNVFNVSISPKPDQEQAAFATVLTEVNRAVKFGFTNAEIERTITTFKNYYENQIIKEEDRSHSSIAERIKDNYLNKNTITDIAKEYEIVQAIFVDLKPVEIHKRLKELYTQKNRFLMVTGVKEKDNLTENEAVNILKSVENNKDLIAHTDEFSGKTLISGVTIKSGKIIKETENKVIGSTTYVLNNGIKVHYKFANKNKNDVRLKAISNGGMSLLKDADLPSANLLENVIQYSGLGNYTATELSKVMVGKTAKATINLSHLTENIVGASVTKDVETMLQMLYLRFVKPRFDKEGYDVIMQNVKNYQVRRSQNINEKINDSVVVTLYGDKHPRHRIFNDSFVSDISFDKIKSIYQKRFGNAADFEFFIVGDVQKDQLKPLIEKYIASIPTNDIMEHWKDDTSDWKQKKIDKDIYLEMKDAKSSVRITYKNKFKYSLKQNIVASVLADVLNLRFTETLREEEGGTYGASVSANLSKKPLQQAVLSISFDCDPKKVDALVAIVDKEIEKIANGEIAQLDLDKTLTNYLKERKQQKDYNSFDMGMLTVFYRDGYNINDPKNFEEIIESITKKDVQKFIKILLKDSKYYKIVFKPLSVDNE